MIIGYKKHKCKGKFIDDNKLKIIFKTIIRVIFILLGICLMFIIGCFIFNKICLSREYKILEQAGYVNKVNVGDYSLNVNLYGNLDSKHTIVGISGMQTNDFSISITPVTEKLLNNKIAVIDRAGYGMSDDTHKKQSVEQIVNDYRNALKNSGCNGPYILMAHSLGGVYATYWELNFPDEIEAVIYLDPTQLTDLSDLDTDPSWNVTTIDYLNVIGTKLGLGRLYMMFSNAEKPWGGIEKEKIKYSKVLNYNNIYSFAMYSETKEAKNNLYKTQKMLKENNIPKLYIDATLYTEQDVIDMFEYINTLYDSIGSDDKVDTNTEEFKKKIPNILIAYKYAYDNYSAPYIEKLGNVKVVHIAGYHHIHMQKPEEVSESIIEFITTLEEK